MTKLRHTQGFSLVEMIIYVTILSFMLVVIVSILVTITKAGRGIKAAREIQDSGSLSLERIVRETRQATSVNTASSTLDTSPGVLMLTSTDSSGNAETVQFYLQSNALHLKINGVDKGALTRSDTSVTNLIFTKITTVHSQAVRTQMTIESGTSTSYRSSKFYTTTVLRGSL
jgi:competence protein ComGC